MGGVPTLDTKISVDSFRSMQQRVKDACGWKETLNGGGTYTVTPLKYRYLYFNQLSGGKETLGGVTYVTQISITQVNFAFSNRPKRMG
jgi:hypothetical protein